MRKEGSQFAFPDVPKTHNFETGYFIFEHLSYDQKLENQKKGANNILVPVSSGSNCQHLLDHRKSKWNSQKTSTVSDYANAFEMCGSQTKLWKTLKRWNTRPPT